MGTSQNRPGASAETWQQCQHISLDKAPDAVRRARQLVVSCFSVNPDSAYDAELVLSELVTNAVLHGAAPIDVYVYSSESRLRVEVHDAGRTPPIMARPNAGSMTGRGLGMVATLSQAWGVAAVPSGGKFVWAELGPCPNEAPPAQDGASLTAQDGAATDRHGPIDVAALLAAWQDDEDAEPVYTVNLGPVATELLAAAKAHIDNVVRELSLLQEGLLHEGPGAGTAGPWSAAELDAALDVITHRFGAARLELKREAAAALARGDLVADLVLHLPPSAADAGEEYLEALDRIDRYARSAQILTLDSPPGHRLFRRWYVTRVVEQLRALSQGEEPPKPLPFQVVLGREVARLAPLEHMSARLGLLQRVSRDLATLTDPRAMAEVVVEGVMELTEVETARVRLLDDDDMLQSVAWRGRRPNEPSEALPAYSLHSEFSSARAVRTGEPVAIRSLAEEFGGRSDLLAFYNKDLSVRIVPLASGGLRFGMLSLTFGAGALGDEDELALVSSLAGVLSQALARADFAAREQERRQTLDFLADASQIMTSVREPAQVLEEFVRLAVPVLGDWCTVYLPDETGQYLRRAAVAIDSHPDVALGLQGTKLDLALELPQTRAFRTGHAQPPHYNTEALRQDLYPELDFERQGWKVESTSGVCVPIVLRGEVVGVIGLTFLSGRRGPTRAVQEALAGLADRAAVALDNARNWAAREQLVRSLVTALLPAAPPQVPGYAFASRYLPADGRVAGDWWEVDVLADGAVLIGLGDAAGHGVPAVSQMLQLRHGARALASVERSPAALLADLNRRLGRADSGIATAFYGRLDPATGTLTWASAGHLPPLHLFADGKGELLAPGGGAALGAPLDVASTDHDFVLRQGETLVLYSDGAVERRQEDLGLGIARLLATAQEWASKDLDVLADALVEEHCTRRSDDCCLLLVRRLGG
ncbi:MAG TPA: SpoIIE family protein phosphatase [Acidimicrobiales bacterium]|nr:SpoIIE family protein phosphatase [Acidimicrobiales bacterium]